MKLFSKYFSNSILSSSAIYIFKARLPIITHQMSRPASTWLSDNKSHKKSKLTSREYSELVDLLSDSDDWDEDSLSVLTRPPKTTTSEFNNNKEITSKGIVIDRSTLSGLENSKIIGAIQKEHYKIPDLPSIPLGRSPFFEKQAIKPEEQSSQQINVLEPTSKIEEKKDLSILEVEDINAEVKEKQLESKHNTQEIITCNDSTFSTEPEEKKPRGNMGTKFALLTQAPNFGNTSNTENKLHLAPHTKVKIPICLSKEQEDIMDLACLGYNIFYTGSAGTGKSVLLKEMIKSLKKKYGHDQVAVTASTGLAACNIGGFTVHSFAGIGLGKGAVELLYKKVRRSRKHLKRWETISALVVDEISMLDAELIDKLDFIARKIRKNHSPFGGIQMIFCGDFFQLPPVSKDPTNPTKFAFESNAWKAGIQVTIRLQKIFRQQGDSKFISMLNQMRSGKIDDETDMEFKKLNRPLPDDDIIPAELYSTRNEVDRANNQRLCKLPGKTHVFKAIDGGDMKDEELRSKLLQNFLAPKELQLKVGAQVMMIKNVDAKLVNGSLGKVIDFMDNETYMFYDTMIHQPELKFRDLEHLRDNPDSLLNAYQDNQDEDNVQPRQKVQKDAFNRYNPDEANTRLGKSVFDFLKEVDGKTPESDENLKRKMELLQDIHNSSTGRKLPLVRFKTPDQDTRLVLVEPEDWSIEDEQEKPIVSRVQLPLMLAWSLSIHKSQGQTLPKVKVDLKRVFEKGQAYVALSRAVSRDGLQVLNFDKSRVGVHQKVIEFYETLSSVEDAKKTLNGVEAKAPVLQQRLNFAPNRPSLDRSKRATGKSVKRDGSSGSSDRIIELLRKRSSRQ